MGLASGATTDAPVGPVPPKIAEAAATLGGPVEIYEWVRSAIRAEFYYGAMKGPLQTYLERSGNDADTAALLVQLLRAKGIPARFGRGKIKVSGSVLASVCGAATAEQAVRVLERGGVPHEIDLEAGGLAVRMERIWAEAYLPYANYRGTLLDRQGGTWVALDGAFKPLTSPNEFDIVQRLGFDPRAAWEDYLSMPRDRRPLEVVRESVSTLLLDQQVGLAYDNILNTRDVIPEALGILPNTLPYPVLELTEASYDLPESLAHTVRFIAERDGEEALDVSFPTSRLLGQRVTLSFVPFSDEDRATVAAFGSLLETPPYLVDVKAVVRLGGVAIGAAEKPIGMGVPFTFKMEIGTPGGTETIENTLTAGNLVAIGLSGSKVTALEARTDQAASILAGIAAGFFDRWNASDEELSRLLKVIPVRPTVSACLVASTIAIEYAGGDPLYPLSFDWKAVQIDADLRSSAPVGIFGRSAEAPYTLLSGLEGSVLEHLILEERVKAESVSTAKALGLAAAAGLTIHDITLANAGSILPTLPFDAQVMGEVSSAVGRGWLVRIPAASTSHFLWTGVGYVLLDEQTGEGAYQLQGGHSGGESAARIPAEVADILVKQREEPEDAKGREVAHIQMLHMTNYQEGIVNEQVSMPLAVEVADAEGYAIEGATVTFEVRSGGGMLVDRATGAESTKATVLTDIYGIARVGQRLGKKTSDWPGYMCEAGQSCDGETSFPTQVGVNMVTAFAGTEVLTVPFESYGLPDQRGPDPTLRYGFLRRLNFPFGRCNMCAEVQLWLDMFDQWGNPLSNWPLTVRYEGPPTLEDPLVKSKKFKSRCRNFVPSNPDTPGGVLNTKEFDTCAKKGLPVLRSSCPVDESKTVTTSMYGAQYYLVTGDSPYSYYRYPIFTNLGEEISHFSISTWGMLCESENPNDCTCSQPAHDVELQSRSGGYGEAYAPGGTGKLVFGASLLYEKEKITRSVDQHGQPHYTAEGTNVWIHKPLPNGEFEFRAETQGTTVTTPTYVGQGRFVGEMRLSSTPQLNTASYSCKLFPEVIPYLPPPRSHEVDPSHVDDSTLEVTRVTEPHRPWTFSDEVSMWGVRPHLDTVTPSPIPVDEVGSVLAPATISGGIDPPDYVKLIDARQIRTTLSNAEGKVGTSPGVGMSIDVGAHLPAGTYTARVAIQGVGGPEADPDLPLESDPLPVVTEAEACPLLTRHPDDALVEIYYTIDPWGGPPCGIDKSLRFQLCHDAKVSLTVNGKDLTARIDSSADRLTIKDVALVKGQHFVVLSPSDLGEGVQDRNDPSTRYFDYLLTAVSLENADKKETATGRIAVTTRFNRAVLPVGRTFVKGVDLFDGHMVRQSSDLKVPGRHLSLEVTRTYSSSGQNSEGLLGAGWGMSYEAQLAIGTCNITVRTPDGSSQVFRLRGDGSGTYQPQPGYHTRLVRNPDESYDFFDKANVRTRFAQAPDNTDPTHPRRWEYTEEPHGDRIVPKYEAERLVSVGEYPRGASEPIRSVEIKYHETMYGGHWRVKSVSSPALALEATYTYDEFGNLETATRSGKNLSGESAEPQVEEFHYSTSSTNDPHQLVTAVDANDHRTDYVYYTEADQLPGEAGHEIFFVDKEERVRLVREYVKGLSTVETEYVYDAREGLQGRFKTKVTDPLTHSTDYVLNGNGSPLEIHEPLGKSTYMSWSPADIVKTWEKDANGRETNFGHDGNGNLTSETIHTNDPSIVGADGRGDVTTSYVYDPTFNKLTNKTDALGRSSNFFPNGRGDITDAFDGARNHTHNEFDEEGRLVSSRDPRGNTTTYSDWDPFGTPRRANGPGTFWKQKETDGRGRVTHEWDSLGHETSTTYDGFDRPVMVRKVSGQGSNADEVTSTRYYPNGQVWKVTNARDAETTYEIDGLDRVTSAVTNVPGGRSFGIESNYDGNGNKTSEKDARGVLRRFAYDDLNRLRKVEIVSGSFSGTEPSGTIAEYRLRSGGQQALGDQPRRPQD